MLEAHRESSSETERAASGNREAALQSENLTDLVGTPVCPRLLITDSLIQPEKIFSTSHDSTTSQISRRTSKSH